MKKDDLETKEETLRRLQRDADDRARRAMREAAELLNLSQAIEETLRDTGNNNERH